MSPDCLVDGVDGIPTPLKNMKVSWDDTTNQLWFYISGTVKKNVLSWFATHPFPIDVCFWPLLISKTRLAFSLKTCQPSHRPDWLHTTCFSSVVVDVYPPSSTDAPMCIDTYQYQCVYIHIYAKKNWAIYIYTHIYLFVPVVPHKAVAEVSKIGNL